MTTIQDEPILITDKTVVAVCFIYCELFVVLYVFVYIPIFSDMPFMLNNFVQLII